MKRSAGFTLIELVIVIIILGILAVTAAPKFINLQSDARESTLKGVEAAAESVASMAYSKAVIQGHETAATSTVTINSTDRNMVYGYPRADEVVALLDINASDDEDATNVDFFYKVGNNNGNVEIWPVGSYSDTVGKCSVTYTNATEGKRPVITFNSGC